MTKRQYLLNREEVYIIYPNLAGKELHTNTDFEANLFYTIMPLEEMQENRTTTQKLAGRAISANTTFDFSSYMNKPVYIKGKFEYGLPKLIEQNQNIPNSFTEKQVVLKINDLTLVEAQ